MTIDKEILKLITFNDNLNQTQLDILQISNDNIDYKDIIFSKEISKNDFNLLMLLKGIKSLEAQNQIVENYHKILEYNKIKTTVYKNESSNTTQNHDNFSNFTIFCDGACSGNPGFAGSGLAIYKKNQKPVLLYGAFVENGTNNIAELNALLKALQIASKNISEEKIIIFSDSKYSIDCIKTWAYSWKKNGWSKKGGEIKNLELIKESHFLYEDIKNSIELNHVKGHSGVEGNELADRMAVNAILEKNIEFKEFEYTNIEDVLKLKSY